VEYHISIPKLYLQDASVAVRQFNRISVSLSFSLVKGPSTAIYRLPLEIRPWKSDVLPENANREPISHYFKRGKMIMRYNFNPKPP
jgi:hypothetical protein